MPARKDEDLAACRKEAVSPYTFGMSRESRIDRDAFNRCMARRGYSVNLKR
jgi:hypothetical protein